MQAFEKYYQMSAGDWVEDTPESWYVSSVAEYLALSQFCISLESSARELRQSANRGKRGRTSKMYRSNGRADIAIWEQDKDEEYYPDGLIEIKRAFKWSDGPFRKDLERLAVSLASTGQEAGTGTITFGAFLVVSAVGASKKSDAKTHLKKRFKSFRKRVETFLNGFNESNPSKVKLELQSDLRLGHFYIEDKAMPSAMCFMLVGKSD